MNRQDVWDLFATCWFPAPDWRTPYIEAIDHASQPPAGEAGCHAHTRVGQSGFSIDAACSVASIDESCAPPPPVATTQLSSRLKASWEGDPGSAV